MQQIKQAFIKVFLLPLLVLGMAACSEDFLELPPNEALPTDQAIQTLSDLQAAVIGIYDQLGNSDYYGRYFVLTPDVMSDDVKQNSSANRAKDWAEYAGNVNDLHSIPQEIWTEVYEAVNRANVVINADIEVPATVEADRNQLVGEAIALRALAHFDLVRIYAQHYGFTNDNSHAGIPYVTEFDQNALPGRSSVKEVYDKVIADLNTAIGLMGEGFNQGRMSKTAARALLARIYLYQSNWSEAEKFANDVISSGKATLTPTASYVSTWMADSYSPDAIFDVVMNAADNRGADALGRMYIQQGYGDYLPSLDLYNLISDNDVRKQLYKEDNTIGGGVYGNLRVNKYPSLQGFDNTPVIRLAEMYLIRAEARANLNNPTGAQADVNTIRQRANPNAPAVTATGQALLDEIELEKRIELAFEGHRLWELMRKKRGVIRNDCTAPNACTINYPNDRFILPIPQEELFVNPNLSQNPGY